MVVICAVAVTAGSCEVAVTEVVLLRPASWPDGMVILTSISALAPGLSVTVAGIGCTLQPRFDDAVRPTVSVKLPLLVSVNVSVKVWVGGRVNVAGSGDQTSAAFCVTVT